MSLSRAITDYVGRVGDVPREELFAHFMAANKTRERVRNAINTAQRNGWITQAERRRKGPECSYVRTDVSLHHHYRSARIDAIFGDGNGMGNLGRAETVWRDAMGDQRFEDAEASLRRVSVGKPLTASVDVSLTGSAAAMCAGMLR